MRNGDPAADDYLPQRPNLSGEWADDLTPARLYERITGKTAGLAIGCTPIDALADAYDDGVSETFGLACEAALVEFCGERIEGMPENYRETPLFGGQLWAAETTSQPLLC
jgi:hypothetical protein